MTSSVTPPRKVAQSAALVEEMKGRGIEVVEATSAADGTSVITSDSAIHVVLIDWRLSESNEQRARACVHQVRCARATTRSRSSSWPSDGEATDIPIEVMEMVDEFVWTLEDTAAFVGGRVVASIRRYLDSDDAAAGRGDVAVHAGVRVLLAHARPRRRHGLPQVSGGSRVLRLLRRKPAAIGPVDQRRARSARCSIIRGRWANTSGMRRACSARIARTASPTARRCRTASSSWRPWVATRSRSAIATATSRSSTAWS